MTSFLVSMFFTFINQVETNKCHHCIFLDKTGSRSIPLYLYLSIWSFLLIWPDLGLIWCWVVQMVANNCFRLWQYLGHFVTMISNLASIWQNMFHWGHFLTYTYTTLLTTNNRSETRNTAIERSHWYAPKAYVKFSK